MLKDFEGMWKDFKGIVIKDSKTFWRILLGFWKDVGMDFKGIFTDFDKGF